MSSTICFHLDLSKVLSANVLMEKVFPHCKHSSEMFADDSFYFLMNDRKFSKGKENTVEKG